MNKRNYFEAILTILYEKSMTSTPPYPFLEAFMKTLSLEAAALFLQLHHVTLAERARKGEIPAAKVGKRWVFIEEDLAAYLRSLYAPAPRVLLGDQREEKSCHSTNAKTPPYGGLSSTTNMDAYSKALGHPISARRGNTMTS